MKTVKTVNIDSTYDSRTESDEVRRGPHIENNRKQVSKVHQRMHNYDMISDRATVLLILRAGEVIKEKTIDIDHGEDLEQCTIDMIIIPPPRPFTYS